MYNLVCSPVCVCMCYTLLATIFLGSLPENRITNTFAVENKKKNTTWKNIAIKKKKILFHFFCFCCCLCFGLCVYTEYVCSNHKTFEIFLVHSILIPHRKAPNRPSSLYMCVELEWNNNDDVDDDYECRKKKFLFFFVFATHSKW